MNKKRKEIIANNEISEIYTLNLGGYNQKVLVEGKKKEWVDYTTRVTQWEIDEYLSKY